jgi:hypothetical protein
MDDSLSGQNLAQLILIGCSIHRAKTDMSEADNAVSIDNHAGGHTLNFEALRRLS